uniref:Uncharacterized protein n=1 Tax=Leersia perrieri TaxID=77586 RepID=A0A0D9XBN9_9ORYZ
MLLLRPLPCGKVNTDQVVLNRRYFACPNILNDDFIEPPRRYRFIDWIDRVSPPEDDFRAIIPPEVVSIKYRLVASTGGSIHSEFLNGPSIQSAIVMIVARLQPPLTMQHMGGDTFPANKDDAFTWIDSDVPNYAGEPVTEAETLNEYMRRKNDPKDVCLNCALIINFLMNVIIFYLIEIPLHIKITWQ